MIINITVKQKILVKKNDNERWLAWTYINLDRKRLKAVIIES
jgi:hypothetical protein